MSRIGNRVINLPAGVEIIRGDNTITAKGPKGELTKHIANIIEVKVEDNQVQTLRPNNQKASKQQHGTANSVINNMIEGVTKGFSKTLLIEGVGYRAALKGNVLNLSLGFSHPVNMDIPKGLELELPKNTEIIIKGIDKELVGQFAAEIRKWRKPEPYKGKGIKYKGEVIIRKVGKTAGK